MQTIVRLLFVSALLIAFASPVNAMSRRRVTADDPDARAAVASDEYSPFKLMPVASWIGYLASLAALAPHDGPDAGRAGHQQAAEFATGVLIYGGSFHLLMASVSTVDISQEERDKLGTILPSEVDPSRLTYDRGLFWTFHVISTGSLVALAHNSEKSGKWTWPAVHFLLPFVADGAARTIFGVRLASPCTLTVSMLESGREFSPALVFGMSW